MYRYHLQAFRHLYVLAVESRLLMPRDIDSEFPVYANVNMKFIDTKYYKNQEVKLMAPCLLPELKYLKQVICIHVIDRFNCTLLVPVK